MEVKKNPADKDQSYEMGILLDWSPKFLRKTYLNGYNLKQNISETPEPQTWKSGQTVIP